MTKHPSQLTDFDQLVDKFRVILSQTSIRHSHISNNTIDSYYKGLIAEIVLDLALVPVNRQVQELDPLDDDDTLEAAFTSIAHMLSMVMAKPLTVVKRDMLKYMKTFPSSDVKTAATLKSQHLLH